jgi:anti-sigma28 factor (negative regulator of flagellin synthesis)
MSNIENGNLVRASGAPSTVEQTEAIQLSRLSSVLNGLEIGARAMRRHAKEALRAVRQGTYRVDAAKLSRRIIREAIILAQLVRTLEAMSRTPAQIPS